MSLLMPDINLRRAKHHLVRYWSQVLDRDQVKNPVFRLKADDQAKLSRESVHTCKTDADSVDAILSIRSLESRMKRNDYSRDTEAIVDRWPESGLDCECSPVAECSSCDRVGNDDKQNQVSSINGASTDQSEGDQFLQVEKAVGDIQQASSTTEMSSSTKGTIIRTDTASFTHRSYSSPKYMLQLQVGPTLGSVMQRIRLNDGDVSELDLSTLAERNKRLGSEGCALVARSLSTNHTVRKLIIRDHDIGDDGAIALSKMLCNNKTLEHLEMYRNNISDRGAKAIAQALYGHDSLTHLCLRNNLITDRGAVALAQSISCNCKLKSLELAHNRITQVGAQALLDALEVNLHLEIINLDANDVPTFVRGQLAAALARNRAESLILESHAAEKKAKDIVRRVSGLYVQDKDKSSSEMEDDWEEDDSESVSSGFLSCSGVTDIPLSSSGLWI